MDLFRVNQLIDSLEKKYKADYPRLADFIKPSLRLALLFFPLLAGLIYLAIFKLCWPYITSSQLILPGSEAENSLFYILVFIPCQCLFSIPFILPSRWVMENLSVTNAIVTVERIGALSILLAMGCAVTFMNGEILSVLKPMTADRVTLLSVLCYSAVAMTYFICHWPNNRRIASTT